MFRIQCFQFPSEHLPSAIFVLIFIPIFVDEDRDKDGRGVCGDARSAAIGEEESASKIGEGKSPIGVKLSA